MLYKILLKDDFDIDIVELLRDTMDDAKEKLKGIKRQDISEIYLFFDLDIHQDNLSKNDNNSINVVSKMLDVFDNETENGKLYISYPMVEALYDYKEGLCEAYSNCFIPLEEVKNYKNLSVENNYSVNLTKKIESWKSILNVFSLRIKCLFGFDILNYFIYRDKVSPKTIYDLEHKILKDNKHIFVLSSLPKFLYDYFRKDFWNSMHRIKHNKYIKCKKPI